jgi:hypothetical protein
MLPAYINILVGKLRKKNLLFLLVIFVSWFEINQTFTGVLGIDSVDL